jgi:hypothetical protein
MTELIIVGRLDFTDELGFRMRREIALAIHKERKLRYRLARIGVRGEFTEMRPRQLTPPQTQLSSGCLPRRQLRAGISHRRKFFP